MADQEIKEGLYIRDIRSIKREESLFAKKTSSRVMFSFYLKEIWIFKLKEKIIDLQTKTDFKESYFLFMLETCECCT